MCKLKFHLQKLEKNLTFQILDQKGVTQGRSNTYEINTPLVINNFQVTISSITSPAISIGNYGYFFGSTSDDITNKIDRESLNNNNRIVIYLRGDDYSKNDYVTLIPFESNRERDIVYDIMIKSLKKFCEDE